MSDEQRKADDRLQELLAGRELDDLSPDEREELESLLTEQGATPPPGTTLGELLLLLDRADVAEGGDQDMPAAFRDRLAQQGKAMLAADPAAPQTAPGAPPPPADVAGLVGPRSYVPLAIAALLALAGAGVSIWALGSLNRSNRESEQLAQQIEDKEAEATRLAGELQDARDQASANARMLADARARAQSLQTDFDTELAEASARNLELAEQLATATEDLNAARITLATYEQPRDPAELAASRQQIASLPGSVRIEMSPFDVEGLPPTEQRGEVTGDVVWNDELETGYLRFVGLDPNDPNIEQYQVWVIDERGLEQKVSGGVFDVTEAGEVIVPIDPGINVGRVTLFAVTVEEPGGTWVPSLERRVIVAPRGEG